MKGGPQVIECPDCGAWIRADDWGSHKATHANLPVTR